MNTLLIVQISDIHFLENDFSVSKRALEIAASLQTHLARASKVLVAITGDIAQSGKASQFEVAEIFFKELVQDLNKRHGEIPFVVAVPGNHDADFDSPGKKIRSIILERLRNDSIDIISSEELEVCVSVFEAYNSFAENVQNLVPTAISPIWNKFSLEMPTRKVTIHCVNNAWSCEKDTDPGSLTFPTQMHLSCIDSEEDSLSILLMHHPAHWVSSRQYREFRRFSRQCATIVFTGHEHLANTGLNTDKESGSTLYIEGAALQEHYAKDRSGFTTTLIDLDDDKIETNEFKWNGSIYYCDEEAFIQPLPLKQENIGLNQSWTSFLSDIGSNIAHPAKSKLDLADIYVHPELETSTEDDELAIESSNKLFRNISSDLDSYLIKGEQSSGKTALIKRLFSAAIDAGIFPLYINASKLGSSSNKEIQKAIDRAIQNQYSDQQILLVRQAYPEKKILLIDNIDRYVFPDKYLPSVLKYLSKQFGRIIATADTSFDLKEALLSSEFNEFKTFKQYKISEFGFRLRFELVKKWFGVLESLAPNEQQIELADKIISRVVSRGLVPSYPLYILVILQSIEVGRDGELENSALGYYYEYMILSALENRIRQEHIHEVLNYCSHFAWFMHRNSKDRLSEQQFRMFHGSFESKFDLQINLEDRKSVLLDAGLISQSDQDFGFKYPYSYYFFLGRYLSRSLNEMETKDFVLDCCENLHVRDKGNAMLFLAHHSNDSYVFDCLKKSVDSKFSSFASLKFDQDTKKLDELVERAPIMVLNDSTRLQERERAQEENQRIDNRLDNVSNRQSTTNESEQAQVLDLLAEINGLMKGIEILGTAIKTNFGSINSTSKQALIGSVFEGGLRGLRVFVEAFSEMPDYLLAEVSSVVSEDFSDSADREKAIKVHVFSVIGRFSFWFIQKVGASIGSKSMVPALNRYVSANDTIANNLVAMSSMLETPGRIPFEELRNINDRVSKAAFAQSVLKLIVLTRMHMYRTAEAEKQQVCQELGIHMSTQRAIAYRTKDTKKLDPHHGRST